MFPASHSPVHRLPVELLSRIFVEGVSVDYPYSHSPFLFKPNQPKYREEDQTIRSPNFQLLVSHVCKQWRDIALNNASLWSTIHLSRPGHLPRAREYIRRCLPPLNDANRHRRSPTQLIDIMVDTVSPGECRDGSDLCKDHFDDVFEIIMPHVLLWRSFHLKVRDDGCKLLARKHLCAATAGPHLETLQLYHFEAFKEARDLWIATYRPPVIVFHNNLPKLRNVSLIGVNLNWADSNHLHTLNHLQLALHSDNIRPPYTHFAAMLRGSPNLQTLCLHYSGPKNSDGDPAHIWASIYEVIDLPCLKDLTLVDLDPGYLDAVMERLRAPSLVKLTLELSQSDAESSERGYSSFLDLLVKGKEIRKPGSHPLQDSAQVNSAVDGTPTATAPQPPPSLVPSTPPTTHPLSVHQPPHEVQIISHTPSSQTTTHSDTSSHATAKATTFRLRPLPNISYLTQLVVTALDCSLDSWRSLLRTLNALEQLEVDFDKLSAARISEDEDRGLAGVATTGDGMENFSEEDEPEENAFFKAVFEERPAIIKSSRRRPDDTTPSASSPSSKQGSRHGSRCASPSRSGETRPSRTYEPLLPKLRSFKMAGVSGLLVKEFIVYREGGWLRRAPTDTSGLNAVALKVPSGRVLMPPPELRKYALEQYLVRRVLPTLQDDRDDILDELITHGCQVSAMDLPCSGHGFSDDSPIGWTVRVEEEIVEEPMDEGVDEEDEDGYEVEVEDYQDEPEEQNSVTQGVTFPGGSHGTGNYAALAAPNPQDADVDVDEEEWSTDEEGIDDEDDLL